MRCFRDAGIDFHHPGRDDSSSTAPNVKLVLVDNGAGKITILRAIALAVLSPVIVSLGFVPYRLVHQTPAQTPEAAEVNAGEERTTYQRKIDRALSPRSAHSNCMRAFHRLYQADPVAAGGLYGAAKRYLATLES